jgi:hypothetical protein
MSIQLIPQDEVAETLIVKRAIHIPYDESISYFCHLSKNLWNQAHKIYDIIKNMDWYQLMKN